MITLSHITHQSVIVVVSRSSGPDRTCTCTCTCPRKFQQNVQAVDVHMRTRFLRALNSLFDELIDVPVPVNDYVSG